jgi:hypothetical protein
MPWPWDNLIIKRLTDLAGRDLATGAWLFCPSMMMTRILSELAKCAVRRKYAESTLKVRRPGAKFSPHAESPIRAIAQ